MPQTYGLSTRLRDHADSLEDDFLAYTADSHVCEREMRDLRHKIAELTARAAHLDDTFRILVSGGKTGFNVKRMQSQVREQRDLYGETPEYATPPTCLVTYRNEKRREDGTPHDAA